MFSMTKVILILGTIRNKENIQILKTGDLVLLIKSIIRDNGKIETYSTPQFT